MYRAVYNPPAGGSKASATLTSITLNYTGGSGAPRWYKYRDGSADSYVTDGGAGPALVVFSGLTQSTSYTLALYGGNTEGYLSINSVGGYYSTNAPVSPPTITSSSNTANSITLNFTAGAGSTSTRAYLNGGFDGSTGLTTYTFTGLLPSSSYFLTLYGYDGTTQSGTYAGGTYSTAAALVQLATPTGVTASTTFTDRIRITWNPVANASTYGVWYRGGAPVLDSAPDFPTTSSLFLDDTGVSSGGQRQYDVQAYPAAGSTSFTKSNWGGPSNLGLRATVVVVTPTVGSPSISFSSSATTYTWTVSASATDATNVEFNWEAGSSSSGPATASGTVFAGAGSGTASTTFTQTVASGRNWGRVRARANNSGSGLSSSFTAFSAWT
jgi:hypothetical protein